MIEERIDLDVCISSMAGGDQAAFRELYEMIKGPVYYFALSIVKNEEDAKDIMQDAFLTIRANALSYRPGTNPKAWIFKIVRNLATDVLRSRNKTAGIDDFEEMPDGDSFEERVADGNAVLQLLSILGNDEREIVKLHIFGELSHLEIARTLLMPYGQVRWKYAFALRKLRRHLKIGKGVIYEDE